MEDSGLGDSGRSDSGGGSCAERIPSEEIQVGRTVHRWGARYWCIDPSLLISPEIGFDSAAHGIHYDIDAEIRAAVAHNYLVNDIERGISGAFCGISGN